MGVSLQFRDVGLKKLQTEELVEWISKVRSKKTAMKRKRRKDLRVEAILSSTLLRAEHELKSKQQERYRRWQRVKVELCKNLENSRQNATNSDWDYQACDDISSFNSFMSMLKEVKISPQR